MINVTRLLKYWDKVMRHTSAYHQTNVKSFEVPPICENQQWISIVEEARKCLSDLPHRQKSGKLPISTDKLMHRLRQNNHLFDTFKQLMEGSTTHVGNMRWPGLVTLMLARAVGNPFSSDNFVCKALEDAIWSSQIKLAEVVNLIDSNLIFQRERRRISQSQKTKRFARASNHVENLVQRYLTSSVVFAIASMNNYKAMWLMANVLETISSSTLLTNYTNHINHRLLEWEENVFNPHGMLLARGCQSTLELAGHNEELQKIAFDFGRSFMLAIKANRDIQNYQNYQSSRSSTIDLASFPVVLHLERHPETLAYIYSLGEMDNLDYNNLNATLISNSAIDEAKEELNRYVQVALKILYNIKIFKANEITKYLFKLVDTLTKITM